MKTPKHIALPLTLKHITGSTQAVTLLNRFGHGMSESQLLECETAMAERQIQQQNAGVAIVPSNIRSSGFVTFCWDNNDINEETPSGSGTTHCTNGIVVQRQCPSTAACAEYVSGTMYCVPNRHRRSFNPLADPQIEYNAGRRQAPLPISVLNEQLTVKTGILPVDADFAWILARLLQVDSQNVGQISERQQTPGWSGFNSLLHRHDEIRHSAIGYLPIIPTSPTQLSTVYLLLQRSIAVADELKQESVVIVCDQAIYSKAQEIVCKHRDQFSRVVLRMGGFDIALTFLAVIGKRFGDAGLSDIMVESGIVGTAAVNSVIAGKQYNRSVLSHKIVLEALNRILWREFEGWLVEQPDMEDIVTENLTSSLASFRQANFTSECFRIMTELPTFKSLLEKSRQFCSSLESPTAKFWLSYTQSVWLLLNFIRSTRIADWRMHLQCIRKMIPWLFAYDRVNYSRYLSLYWCEMTVLPRTHPDVHEVFLDGEFCVQRSNSVFSQIHVDQSIEQTVNRDSKTKGGIIGFSRKPGAVQRWVINAHQRAEISKNCKEMAGLDELSTCQHKETGQSRLQRDEASVQAVLEVVTTASNPFSSLGCSSLVNIFSGIVASDEVERDIQHAYDMGEKKIVQFVEERLKSDNIDFFSRLTCLKLKTFSSLVNTRRLQVPGRDVMVRVDRNLFARLLVVAQTRELDLQQVLCYELGPLPWSIECVDGIFF